MGYDIFASMFCTLVRWARIERYALWEGILAVWRTGPIKRRFRTISIGRLVCAFVFATSTLDTMAFEIQLPTTTTIPVGIESTLQVAAIGQDGEVQFAASGIPAGASFDQRTGRLTISPQAKQAGRYPITFAAVANGKAVTGTLSLTIEDPKAKPRPPASAIRKAFACFQVDPPQGVPGSVASVRGLGFAPGTNQVFFGSVSAKITNETTNRIDVIVPSITKAQTVSLSSGDVLFTSGFEDGLSNTGTVDCGTFTVDNFPILDDIGDKTVALGQTLKFTVSGSDPDNAAIGFFVEPVPIPANSSFNAVTGEFTFRPDSNQVGTYDLVFGIFDGFQEVTEAITITVLPPNSMTSLEGVVLTNGEAPLGGVRLVWGTDPGARSETFSQSDGTFVFPDLLVAGKQRLLIDGSTVPGEPAGTYATVPEQIEIIEGGENVLDAPIFLLPLDLDSADPITFGQESVITSSPVVIDGKTFPSIQLTVAANSATDSLSNGDPFNGNVSISMIPSPDRGPMPLPREIELGIYIAVQPFGVQYDPPAEIAFPNVEEFTAGAIVEIFGLNHDTGAFEAVGLGEAGGDGMIHSGVIDSNGNFARVGIIKENSWHGFVPQPPEGANDPGSGGNFTGGQGPGGSGGPNGEGPNSGGPDGGPNGGAGGPNGGGPNGGGPDGPDDSNQEHFNGCGLGSEGCPRTGNLSIRHNLGLYRSMERTRWLTLVYHSQHAFPNPVISKFWQPGNLSPSPSNIFTNVAIAGVTSAGSRRKGGGAGVLPIGIFFDSPLCTGLSCPLARFPNAIDASNFPTGVYPVTQEVECNFPISKRTEFDSQFVSVVNQIESPFGVGWSLLGLEKIHRSENGEFLISDGSIQGVLFRPAVRAIATLAGPGEQHMYEFSGSQGDTVSLRLERLSSNSDGSGELDPYIEIRNSQNVVIAADDNSLESSIAGPGEDAQVSGFELPATDIYKIVVRGSNATHGPYALYLIAADATSLTTQKLRVADSLPGIGNGKTNSIIERVMLRPSGDFSELRLESDGTFLRLFKDGTRNFYSADGDLVTTADRHGNQTHYEYDDEGRITSIVDPVGLETEFKYGGNNASPNCPNRIRKITDPVGRATKFEHNNQCNLIAIVQPDGARREYSYSGPNLLTAQTSPNGTLTPSNEDFLTKYEYDFSGRLVEAILPDGESRSLVSDQSVGLVEPPSSCDSDDVRATGKGAIAVNPGCLGNPAIPVSAGNIEASFTDASNRVISLGPLTAFGLTQTRTDPAGRETLVDWTANGDVRTVVLPSGDIFMSAYDDRGNRTEVINGTLGGLRSTTYDPTLSLVTREVNEYGGETRYIYDGGNNPERVVDAVGGTTMSEFRGDGLPSNFVDENGLAYRYEYNKNLLVEQVTLGEAAAARVFRFAYTSSGQVAEYVDAEGGATTYSYDELDRLTGVVLPGGRAASFEYDTNGNRTSIIVPSGHSHKLRYDQRNRATSITPPRVPGEADGPVLFGYSADEDFVLIDVPGSLRLEQMFDQAGQLSSVQTSNGDYTLTYDDQTGLLQRIEKADSVLNFSYVGSYLVSEEWSGSVAGLVDWELDVGGAITAIRVNGQEVLERGYDLEGRVISVGGAAIARHSSGLIKHVNLGQLRSVYTYTEFGELESKHYYFGESPIYSTTLSRDRLGRIMTKTETVLGEQSVYGYAYDAAGRLAAVTENTNLVSEYTYDVSGNILTALRGGEFVVSTVDSQDRLTSLGGDQYTYDLAGDLRRKILSTGIQIELAYDEFGNLLSYDSTDGILVEFLSDPTGRYIGKNVNGLPQERILYLGQQPVAEIDSVGAIRSIFAFVPEEPAPLVIIQEGKLLGVVSDERGSPRLVIDSETGEIVQLLVFDEWGKISEAINSDLQPFGFVGGIHHVEAGLTRLGARDYDPELMRWTTKDPFSFRGGSFNLYEYSFNDPVNFWDPSGQEGESIAVGGELGSRNTDDPDSEESKKKFRRQMQNFIQDRLKKKRQACLRRPFNCKGGVSQPIDQVDPRAPKESKKKVGNVCGAACLLRAVKRSCSKKPTKGRSGLIKTRSACGVRG